MSNFKLNKHHRNLLAQLKMGRGHTLRKEYPYTTWEIFGQGCNIPRILWRGSQKTLDNLQVEGYLERIELLGAEEYRLTNLGESILTDSPPKR